MQLFGIDPNFISQLFFQLLWLVAIIFLSMQSQKIQLSLWMGQIRKALLKLKGYSKHATDITLQLVKDFGKPSFDPKSRIDEYIEFVLIQPVSQILLEC